MSFTVRDPVHGFVHADACEAALVESRPMQRLRRVRQLALANLVFPGAEHSRFSHALGVMHLAGRMYDTLARSGDHLDPDPRSPDRRALRAACLLHDIGHAPFSHSAEDLFEGDIDHEEMTRRLIASSEISELLSTHGIDLERVLRLLRGPQEGADPLSPTDALLHRVISGELDVDKMDYLLRDSLFCGVHYGTFDLERVLQTVVPLEDPETGSIGIGVEAGGVHAIEALLLARYYMFTQVYFNVTGKVLELHLNEWLREEGILWSNDPAIFLEQDDVWVMSRLRPSKSPHARALVDRQRYVLAWETNEHLDAASKTAFERALEPLRHQHGSDLLISNAAKDPHRLSRSRVLVRNWNGSLEPLEEASHFIGALSRIDCYRVYSKPEIQAEVSSELAAALSPRAAT